MQNLAKLILIVILSAMALFITAKLISSSKQHYLNGKRWAHEFEELIPKCWSPSKKFLLLLGCPALSSDAQTELAILFTSCLLEAKGLKPVTCNSADFTLCPRGKCLFKCGMENGERSINAVGYNPFKRVHDALPDLCSYFLRYERLNLAHMNWTEFAQDISTQSKKPNMAVQNYFHKPGYPTLRDLFFERIEHRGKSKLFGEFGSYIEELASTPQGFGILLVIDVLIFLLIVAIF